MFCPLCQGGEIKSIEKVLVKDLINLYKSKFGLSINYLFKPTQIDFLECSVCGLKYFYPFSGGDEKFYEYFQKYPWYYLEDKSEYDFAAKFIKSTDRVLEIGSGRGAFAKKIFSNDYTGLEFSKSACELAAQNGIRVFNEQIETHALNNQSKYDVVSSFQVLEHIDNVNSFLQAAIACLKPGGKLILSVPSDESFFGSMVNAYLNLPPHHSSRWSDHALKSVAEIFHLNIESIYHEEIALMHYLSYARTINENFLRKKLGLRPCLVDTSWIQKLIKGIAWLIAKFNAKKLLNKNKPIGHSVVVVYRKS